MTFLFRQWMRGWSSPFCSLIQATLRPNRCPSDRVWHTQDEHSLCPCLGQSDPRYCLMVYLHASAFPAMEDHIVAVAPDHC